VKGEGKGAGEPEKNVMLNKGDGDVKYLLISGLILVARWIGCNLEKGDHI